MADKDARVASGVALDPGVPVDTDEPITDKSKMPKAEPFHSVAKRKEGEVFDPNAARRLAEGRGPGLQDSEAINPAHWEQEYSEKEIRELRAEQVDNEIQRLQQLKEAIKKGEA